MLATEECLANDAVADRIDFVDEPDEGEEETEVEPLEVICYEMR